MATAARRGRPPTHRIAQATIKSWDELPVTMDFAMAANLTRFSTARLVQLTKEGRFPGYQIGSRWYVDKADLLAHIEEQKKIWRKEGVA